MLTAAYSNVSQESGKPGASLPASNGVKHRPPLHSSSQPSMAGNAAAILAAQNSKKSFKGITEGIRLTQRHAPGKLTGNNNSLFGKPAQQETVDSYTIFQAAREGLVDAVSTHIQRDPRQASLVEAGTGFTPLHQASRFNHRGVIELLLDSHATQDKATVEVKPSKSKGGSAYEKVPQTRVDPNATDKQGVTPLHLAARHNSRDAVQCLLKYGANVNAGDVRRKAPIHHAARRGFDRIVKELLSSSYADVNIKDEDNISPLHEAAHGGHATTCQILLEHGANLWSQDVSLTTALMLAASGGSMDVVNILLEAVKKEDAKKHLDYLATQEDEGSNALHLAAQNGKVEIANVLLDHGIEIDSKKKNGQTALHVAVSNGFKEVVELLLKKKCSVNMQDNDHMTPMHKAALYGRSDLIMLLMNHGGDLNARDKKHISPLLCASMQGHGETVTVLLENGAQVTAVDTFMRSCLHVAVLNGNYDVMAPILQHMAHNPPEIDESEHPGAGNIIEWNDTKDQTALHYAAATGNTAVLQCLLEFGARTDAMDLEEKTPLHIASESNSVGCAEYLIKASKGELNDPDIDGMSPLLLASINGHKQMVKILQSLGADNSTKDDQRRTALMLAAMKGQTAVVGILIEHQADIAATDKYKNTALHYACAYNHSHVVKLLLAKNADIRATTLKHETPLDQAINALANEAAIAILQSDRWREAMSARDGHGFTPMENLIKRLPEAAKVVMDRCVECSSDDPEDKDLVMNFNYEYIDAGPDDPMSEYKRWSALEAMGEYKRKDLLSHPLSQNILSVKWMRFARYLFYSNLLTYIIFVVLMMIFIFTVAEPIRTSHIDDVNYCPIYLPKGQEKNVTLFKYYKEHGQMTWEDRHYHDSYHAVLSVLCLVIASVFCLKELIAIIKQPTKYFLTASNYLSLVVIAFTIGALTPIMYSPCLWQWRCAWIASFTCWINFTIYMRRIDGFGIYVIMFTAVLKSVMRITVLLFLFLFAFGSAYYIVMSKLDIWEHIGTNLVTTLVMTIGEIDFFDQYVDVELAPFSVDAYIILILFILTMPIIMMNLLVGVAIGDIDSIQKNSYVTRLKLQMFVIKDMENAFPKMIQRRFYMTNYTVKPNRFKNTRWFKLFQFFGGPTATHFLTEEDPREEYATAADVTNMKARMQYLASLLNHQSELLQKIANKMDVETTPMPLDTMSHSSLLE